MEERREDETSEIPIAILTPQGDFPLAAPTPLVQTVVMTPDIKEYRTLHSLPPVPERGVGMVELRVIILNPGCNPSEEEIISVRLRGEEETLVERAFRLHHLEDCIMWKDFCCQRRRNTLKRKQTEMRLLREWESQ